MEGRLMKFLKSLKGKALTFSVRSQASYRQEDALKKSLSGLQERIRHSEQQVRIEQAHIEHLTDTVVNEGESWASQLIPQHAEKVRGEEAKIVALSPPRDRIQAEIEALTNPSPEERQVRAEHQKAVAALALERLEIDRALAKICLTLRGILEKREEMTRRMGGILGKVEFAPIDLDESRFDKMQKSLPENLAAASEEWVDSFLGENQSGRTEPYVVKEDVLYIEETLANAGVFRRGEQVALTAKQLVEIRSKEQRVVGFLVETMPDGALRSGERIEVTHARVVSVAGGISSSVDEGFLKARNV
jgi:hypothetical protein